MRIALVTREFPPDTAWGGLGTFAAHQSRAFAALGYDVEVFCQSISTDRTEVVHGALVHHVLVRPHGLEPGIAGPTAGLSDLGEFAESLAKTMLSAVSARHALKPFDIIEGHEHLGINAFINEAQLPGAKTVTRYQTAYYSLVSRGLVDWPEAPKIRDLERQSVHLADLRIATSNFIDTVVREDFGVPPADLEIFNLVDTSAPSSAEQPRENLIVFVGRLVLGHKRPDLLAMTFARLAQRFPNWRCEYAGADMSHHGGSSVQALCEELTPEAVRPRVRFHGLLSPTSVRELLRRAKIMVAPSRFESFGLVALEAMHEGCVPLVSDKTALAEVVADPDLIFENGNATSLEKALEQLMANPRQIELKSQRCRAHADKFGENLIQQNVDAYEGLIASQKSETTNPHAAPALRSDPVASAAGSDPLISVIVPSYNQGPYIEETIRSILVQDYPNIELIVVDGGSTDNTVEVLKKFPALRWVSEKDKGQTHAINKGILASRGRIVAYLNSDDVYRPGALRTVADYFAANPEAKIVVGNCDYIDAQSAVIGHLKARCDSIQDLIRYWGWDKWFCVPQQATFWRRSLMSEVGLFNTKLHMVMDFEYWLRAAQVTQFYVIDQTLAAFRLVPGTKTVSRTHEMYREEFETFQRFKKVLPPKDRGRVANEARRHYAKKQILMAQHYLLGANARRLCAKLIWDALSIWPAYVFRPEVVLCAGHLAASLVAPPAKLERMHRFGLRIAPVWKA